MLINKANVQGLFTGYKTIFAGAMQNTETTWPRVAMRTTSTTLTEVYGWLGAWPKMKEFLGEAVIENIAANSFFITNKEFASTVGVKEIDIKTDAYGLYNPRFEMMGFSATSHKDELVSSLLTLGFTEKDYTGKNFFDTDKKHNPGDKKSGTFSNKGTKKLSAANYEAAVAQIKSIKDAAGNPLGIGRKLALVVSPTNEALGKRILNAELIGNGETNVNKGSAELIVWPFLTDANSWFLIETGMPIKPLILQVVQDATFTGITDPDSEHVLLKHEFLFQAYGIYNAGFGLPQLAWGSTGADNA